jgi:inositol-1,3,4-trisphosphate 5/6-kinase/inositol-tetrakisphosphate 1-kinase
MASDGGGEAMVVGYALADKKVKSFIQPSLVEHAKSKGVRLVRVATARPLEDQGPFDAILHKHGSEAWTQHLLDYKARHPRVVLVDPPAAIDKLQNRVSMLEAVHHLRLPPRLGTCGIPKQLIVADTSSERISTDLTFPVIAKPIVADGSATSHAMFLLFNPAGLPKLHPPFVLQARLFFPHICKLAT